MFVALCLNPCWDKTASLPRFSPDAPNRIRTERTDLGGKGVNVARAVKALGGAAWLIAPDFADAPLNAALAAEAIPCRLIPAPGALRVNLKLRETETGRILEISEQGAAADARTLAGIRDALLAACRPGDWAALCGSLPPGAPEDTYADLCRALKGKGCRVAVDCDGPALRRALKAGPALIKPNAQEFAALTGADAADTPAALAACRRLLNEGAEMICLSRGAAGAMLICAEGAFSCPAARVEARGVQGAGDTMLAGLMLALGRGQPAPEALRFAAAAAGASVMRPGTLLCRREDAESLLARMPAAERCS